MRYLILENDSNTLERFFQKYVDDIEHKQIVFAAGYASLGELTDAFKNNDVLLFDPTQILFGQYNSLMMLMYSLMNKNELDIKEINIFNTDAEDIEKRLRYIWRKDREYLDLVLAKIKVYVVCKYDDTHHKIEIHP